MFISLRNIIKFIFIFCFFSCEKENESYFNLSINPTDAYSYMQSGDVITYDINVSSSTSLDLFKITETIENGFPDTLFIVNVPQKNNYTTSFSYQVPDQIGLDSLSEIKITFSARNTEGITVNRAKIIYVSGGEVLQEFSGNNMFSCENNCTPNRLDAYDLFLKEARCSNDSASHIADKCDTINNTLSRCWYSPSGLNFVRNNSFDYVNATSQSAEATYLSSVPQNEICNISLHDIIITKLENQYMVIKITDVRDESGYDTDFYDFSIKQ